MQPLRNKEIIRDHGEITEKLFRYFNQLILKNELLDHRVILSYYPSLDELLRRTHADAIDGKLISLCIDVCQYKTSVIGFGCDLWDCFLNNNNPCDDDDETLFGRKITKPYEIAICKKQGGITVHIGLVLLMLQLLRGETHMRKFLFDETLSNSVCKVIIGMCSLMFSVARGKHNMLFGHSAFILYRYALPHFAEVSTHFRSLPCSDINVLFVSRTLLVIANECSAYNTMGGVDASLLFRNLALMMPGNTIDTFSLRDPASGVCLHGNEKERIEAKSDISRRIMFTRCTDAIAYMIFMREQKLSLESKQEHIDRVYSIFEKYIVCFAADMMRRLVLNESKQEKNRQAYLDMFTEIVTRFHVKHPDAQVSASTLLCVLSVMTHLVKAAVLIHNALHYSSQRGVILMDCLLEIDVEHEIEIPECLYMLVKVFSERICASASVSTLAAVHMLDSDNCGFASVAMRTRNTLKLITSCGLFSATVPDDKVGHCLSAFGKEFAKEPGHENKVLRDTLVLLKGHGRKISEGGESEDVQTESQYIKGMFSAESIPAQIKKIIGREKHSLSVQLVEKSLDALTNKRKQVSWTDRKALDSESTRSLFVLIELLCRRRARRTAVKNTGEHSEKKRTRAGSVKSKQGTRSDSTDSLVHTLLHFVGIDKMSSFISRWLAGIKAGAIERNTYPCITNAITAILESTNISLSSAKESGDIVSSYIESI